MKQKNSVSLRLLLLLFLCIPALSGLTFPDSATPPEKTEQTAPPVDTLSDWQVLQMAIAFTESRFNPEARGKANDLGIYQIVPIYVKEINRLSGEEVFRHEDAVYPDVSVKMFNTMQDFKNPEHDLDLAIYYHNKSSVYKATVMKNRELIERYEEFRKILKEYN